jgi:hypothetical protein
MELGADLQLLPGFLGSASCPGSFPQSNVHPVPGSVLSWYMDLPPVWSQVARLVNRCVDRESSLILAATWNPHFLYLVTGKEVPFQQSNILPLSPSLFILEFVFFSGRIGHRMTPVFHTMAGVIKGLTVNTLRKAVNASAVLNRFARPTAYDPSGKVLQESGSDKPHYIGR